MPCCPGTLQWELAKYVLAPNALPTDAHVLVGYGPIEPLGERLALVKTVLSPGFAGTPEGDYLKRQSSGISLKHFKQDASELLTMQGAWENGGRDVLRMLHRKGYPQVACLQDCVNYFPDELLADGNRLLRHVVMKGKVVGVIHAQTGRL